MENRKLINFLIPILVLGFLMSPHSVFAYGVKTHAFLTSEVIKFYNQYFNNQISDGLRDYLIDGSRREDNMPRYLNHFYDPVNDRGLDAGIYKGYKSKEWSQNEELQNRLVYKAFPSTVASILSVSQKEKIDPIFNKANFTWERAINLYAKDEKEQAFFALGHILHLIEDKAVPDHTRNDPHSPWDDNGSPYENWTHKFSLSNPDTKLLIRLSGKKPSILSDLNSYFDEAARYSNNNFYSRDSIENYELPKPDYFKEIKGDNFGFKEDVEFGDYKLILGGGTFDWAKNKTGDINYPTILAGYWDRLSVKAVQHAAGVVDLFFKEAEEAREKYLLEKAQRPYLATFMTGISAIFGNDKDDVGDFVDEFKLVAEINLEEQEVEVQEEESTDMTTITDEALQEVGLEESLLIIDDELLDEITELVDEMPDMDFMEPLVEIVETQPLKICTFVTDQTPLKEKLIISEVAWAGTLNNTSDEWFELKNISGTELDISGWQVLDKAEQIKITVPANIMLAAGGFYLLERTDDNSVPHVDADQIYTGALSNSDEGLRLYDNECNLIDEIIAGSSWPAGDNGAKRTAERSPDLSWHTYSGSGENNIFGTPKKENSPKVISGAGGGGGGSSSSNDNEPSDNESSNDDSSSSNDIPDSTPQHFSIVINEVMYDLEGVDAGREWVEIFNADDSVVNLEEWKFYENETNHNLNLVQGSTNLEPGGYAVITDDPNKFLNDYPQYSGTLFNSAFSLKNTGETIAIKNGDLIINEVNYQSEWGASGDGKSLQLINNKWQATTPTPGEENRISIVKTNQSPEAFFNFAPIDPEVDEEIIFNAASSTDPDGSIIFYDWDFGDVQNATATQAIIAHSYSTVGEYLVRLVVFDDNNASSTISSVLAIASSTPPTADHIVISEVFVDMEGADQEEFIELYNPTDQAISLANWSLQYLSGSASSTEKIKKKNFTSNASIKPKSFYLIGVGNYGSDVWTDMRWSQSLNNTGATVFLVASTSPIVNIEKANIIDRVAYGTGDGLFFPEEEIASLPSIDQSLERRAAGDGGEFSGNGYDTDDNASDFEVRAMPNPQNSQSLPEPRPVPLAVQNFNASFDPNKAELNFSWDATSTLNYRISDISNASSTVILAESESGAATASKIIKEVGRDYRLEILAVDKDGLASAPTEQILNVSSYLNSIYFYQDSRAGTTSPEYLLELDWDEYPFIPVKYSGSYTSPTDAFHMVRLYYNQEPLPIWGMHAKFSGEYGGWGRDIPGLKVRYPSCYGGRYYTESASLVLPDTAKQCSGIIGGIRSQAVNWNQLEDNHLLLDVVSSNFGTSTPVAPVADKDYVTLAFYAQYVRPDPMNNPQQRLVAIDKTKYYFQDSMPIHQPPTAPSNINFELDQQMGLLKIIWDKSIDVDTLDNLINYEIIYGSTTLTTSNNYLEIFAEPGTIYNFELRAKDDFGNYSNSAFSIYETPDYSAPYGLSVEWGNLNETTSTILNIEFEEYPFVSGTSTIIFFLNQEPPLHYSFQNKSYSVGSKIGGMHSVLELSYYPCDFGGRCMEKRAAAGIFVNNANCPLEPYDTRMRSLLVANIQEGDTQFTTDVVGAVVNRESIDWEFDADDYITLGFYELGKADRNHQANFTNIANYNKKIYFQP